MKNIFEGRYKRLLNRINKAKVEEAVIDLPNGVCLDFTPGHEYDKCLNLHSPYHPDNITAMKKYIDKIEQVVHIDVYDCFSGDVLIRAVGCDRMLVEIIEDVSLCYRCQVTPRLGNKYWVGFEEICSGTARLTMSEDDLPF